MTNWIVTRDVKPKDIKCDLCGKEADTLHFVPHIPGCEKVVFACPKHCPDPDGYWLDLTGPDGWFTKTEHWAEHIERKTNGDNALGLLYDRFHEIKRKLAASDAA